MPKYFTSFKVNASKWPLDPKVALKAAEANFAGMADMEKKGIIKESGSFRPGDGFMIVELPSLAEAYKLAHRFWPQVTMEIREIVSWEETKEIALSVLKEQVK